MNNYKSSLCKYWENRPNSKWAISLSSRDDGADEFPVGKSLAQRDQMHAGTDRATDRFLAWTEIPHAARILELGAGLAGTARHLAARHDTPVCAVELSEHLHRAGLDLTHRLGLDRLVSHVRGDITSIRLPIPPFDAVWIQHVDMQVEDKAGLYLTARAHLGTEGRVFWHDWLRGDGPEPRWPLFWSADGSLSALSTKDEFERNLSQAGLRLSRLDPIEEDTLGWFTAALEALKRSPKGKTSPLLPEMENAVTNIRSGSIIPFFGEAAPIP